jgi:hypothetical protein
MTKVGLSGRTAELFVQQLFKERYGCELKKLAVSDVRRPDYEVTVGDQRVAVLEVKLTTYSGLTVDGIDQLDGRFRSTLAATGLQDVIRGALRRDNSVSRVAGKIHEAAEQLGAFDGLPKILVLVNEELGADRCDLLEALRGYLVYDDGSRVATLGPAAQARIALERQKIDVYFWIDRTGQREAVVATTSIGRTLWRNCFAATQP